MSYAIFRVQPINKLKDLGQIGAHNTRTKEAYKSNPDIDKSKSHNNINLVTPTMYVYQIIETIKIAKSKRIKYSYNI